MPTSLSLVLSVLLTAAEVWTLLATDVKQRAQPETTQPINSRPVHCVPPAMATSSNQEPSGELETMHSLSPHLVCGITYQQN